VTLEQRRADLRAGGFTPAEVAEILAAETVDGVWCDGSIVTDASGRRCVTRATMDRVRDARASTSASSPAAASSSRGVLVVGALVVGLGLLVVLGR
jgi:hypothetical protein